MKLQDHLKRKDMFMALPDDLTEDPGWNVRLDTPELQAHIAMLRESIRTLGVLEPLTVYNQGDQIIVTKASELHLWEDPAAPFRLAFEHPEGRLAVRVIVYGFAAFTAGRYPAASSTIDGTGLIAPTF